jgi:hypothetical protein
VKLDAVLALGRESYPNGLIRDDVGREEPLVRVEDKNTSQWLGSLGNYAAARPRHDHEHADAESSHNANGTLARSLPAGLERNVIGDSPKGNSGSNVGKAQTEPCELAFPGARYILTFPAVPLRAETQLDPPTLA